MDDAEKNSFKPTPIMDNNSPTAAQSNNNNKMQMPSSAPQSPHVPNAGALPRRIINTIPLDFKKLQDAGLHRKLAEALSKQNTNTTKNIASAPTNQWASNSSTSSAAAPTTAATPASHSHTQIQLQKPPQLEQTTATNPLGNNKPLSATEQSLHVKKLIKNKILSKTSQSKPQEQREQQQPTIASSVGQTPNSETNKDRPSQEGGFTGPIAKADLTARSKPPLLLNLVNQLPKQRARCVSVSPRSKRQQEATRPTPSTSVAASQGRAPPTPSTSAAASQGRAPPTPSTSAAASQGRAPSTPVAVQPKSPPPLIVLENKVLAPNERIDFRTLRLPNGQAAIAATPPSIVASSTTVTHELQSAKFMKEAAKKPPNEQLSKILKPTAQKTPLKKIILNVNKRKLPREEIVELAKEVRKQALQHAQQQKQPSTVMSTGDPVIVLCPVTNIITTVSLSNNVGTSLMTQASSSSTLTSSSTATSASLPVITSSLIAPVPEAQTAPPSSAIAPKTVMTMPLTEDMYEPISTQFVESGLPSKAANNQESLPTASLTTSETASSSSSAQNSSKMDAQEVATDELSAVDFIAQLTAIEDVDANKYFELSAEELSLNAKFGCTKIPNPPKSTIKPDDDLAIGKILQMKDMDILHATMNVNDNHSNVLCISPNTINLESSTHPTKVDCVQVKGNPGADSSSPDKFKPLKVTTPKHVYINTKRKIPAPKAPTTVDTTSTRDNVHEQQESDEPPMKVRLLDEAEKKVPCKPKRGKINLVQRNKRTSDSKVNVTQKVASDTAIQEASLVDSSSQDVENEVQSKQKKTINLIPNKDPCINVISSDIEDKEAVGQESTAAISNETPAESSANDIKERSSEVITEQIKNLQSASTSSNEELENTAENNVKSKATLGICKEAGEKAVEDMNEQIVVKSKASKEIKKNIVVANTAVDKKSVISGKGECATTKGDGSTKPNTSVLIPEGSANARDLTQLYHPPKLPKHKLNTLKKNDDQNGSVLEQELQESPPGSAVSLSDIVQQEKPPPQEEVGIKNLGSHLTAENSVPLSEEAKAEEKIKAPRKKLVKTRPVLSSKRPAKASQSRSMVVDEVKQVAAAQTRKQPLHLDGTAPNGGQQQIRLSTSDDDAVLFRGFDESLSINIFKTAQSKETDISDDNSPDNDETEEERHSDKEVFAKKPKTELIVSNNVSEKACEPESKITGPTTNELAPKELVDENTLTKKTEINKANTQEISAEIRMETNILKKTESKQDAPKNTKAYTQNEDTLQKSLSKKQASARSKTPLTQADHLTETTTTKEHMQKIRENITQKEENILQESTLKKDSSMSTEDPQAKKVDNSMKTASKTRASANTNQFPKKKRAKKDTIKDTLDKKRSSVSTEEPAHQAEDTLNETTSSNQSSTTTGEISEQVIEKKKTTRKTTSKKQTEELSETKLIKKHNLKDTAPEKQLVEQKIELPVKPKRTRRTKKEMEESRKLKDVIKTQKSNPIPKETLPATADINNEMLTSTPTLKRKRGRPRKSDVISKNITNINTSLSENSKLLDSSAATAETSTIISNTSAMDSSIAEDPTTPKVKRRRRKGRPTSTCTVIAESTENVSDADKQASDHYKRLLLIRNRAQLDSDEDLRENGHGHGDRQCGLCLARCSSAGWQAHIGGHYGVGWRIEAPAPLLTRSVILKMMKTYIESGRKNLTCRLCGRKLTSALGMFLHIEGCGSKERVVCEFCKNNYTKLSFPAHSRICTERSRALNEEKDNSPTELEKDNETLVYSNAGRAKRKSTLKAETKLEKIAAQSKEHSETLKDFDGDVSDYDMTADKESSDCEDSEDVSSTIDESRSKSTIPKANKTGQKTLYTRMNVKNLMKGRWECFAQQNYAQNSLYPHLLPSYERLSTVKGLLPSKESSSVRYAYGKVDDVGWSRLGPLESVNKENESICYLGKAIKELAWVPLPSTVKTQYLLCSLRNKILGYSRQFKDKPEDALLLLLQCDMLAIKEDKHEVFPLQTQLHYGIYIPDGAVHSLAFMPSGGYDESTNRLALLAVGTGVGVIIYGLPLRVKKESDKKNKQADVVIVLEPLVTLCLDIDNPVQDVCTKICWSESSGHGLLVSGYASGNVAFFDISDDQGLNCIERNDQIYFLPTNFFYFGERNIHYLELHYDTNGARWLAVGTMVRKLWIYDIANISQPLALTGDTVCNMYMGGVNWPPLWESLAIGCTEVYKSQYPRVLALNPSGISFSHATVDLTLSSPRSLHFNRQQLTMVTVTDNGDVVFVQCNQFNLEVLIHKRTKNCRVISVTEPHRLVDTPEPNSISPDQFKRDYGLLLKPLENVPNKKKSNFINIKRRPGFDLLNLMRLNCVRWNWNEYGCNWVAVGSEHGLLRIINFQPEKYFPYF